MAEIAQEIIEEIIDHLRGDDASLQSCALTSRTFVSPCQRYLFQAIALNHARQASRLSSILTTHKNGGLLAEIPRSLYLSSEIFEDSTYLPYLLPLLKSISFVSLCGINENSRDSQSGPRYTIPEVVRKSLNSLIGRQEVRSLELRHIFFPSQILKNLGTKDSLLISAAIIDVNDHMGVPLQLFPVNIGSLTFASRMQSLGGIRHESDSASKIIALASSSLRNLTFNWGTAISELSDPASTFKVLKDCHCLETLRIERHNKDSVIQKYNDFPEDDRPDTGLYDVVDVLKLVSPAAPIRSVHVDMVLDSEADTSEDVYEELDMQLLKFARRGAKVSVMGFIDFVWYKRLTGESKNRTDREFMSRLKEILPRTREAAPGQVTIRSALPKLQ